jgi:hypothetical protein
MANRLALELVADANGLLKTLEQTQRQINSFIRASESAGQSLGGGVNAALDSFVGLSKGGAIAAGVFAGALVAAAGAASVMAIEAGRQAEELSQLSSVMGIGADTLQEYDVLLNRVGLGGQDLTLVMKTLSQKMEEAKTGTGGAADRFRQLGIDITKVGNTDDLIRKVAESVSKFSNGTEKAAVMADLLGKSGLKFIPAFEGGAAAIDEAAASSKRLGATLSVVQLDVLGTMDDSVDDLGLSWKRFSQQMGGVLCTGGADGRRSPDLLVVLGVARLSGNGHGVGHARHQVRGDGAGLHGGGLAGLFRAGLQRGRLVADLGEHQAHRCGGRQADRKAPGDGRPRQPSRRARHGSGAHRQRQGGRRGASVG